MPITRGSSLLSNIGISSYKRRVIKGLLPIGSAFKRLTGSDDQGLDTNCGDFLKVRKSLLLFFQFFNSSILPTLLSLTSRLSLNRTFKATLN
jgi:hypothetical protein